MSLVISDLFLVPLHLSLEMMNHLIDGGIEIIGCGFCEELDVISREVTVSHMGMFLYREIPIEVQLPFKIFLQLFGFPVGDFVDSIGGRQVFVGDFHVHCVLLLVWCPNPGTFTQFTPVFLIRSREIQFNL
jgi:hypothetical protein